MKNTAANSPWRRGRPPPCRTRSFVRPRDLSHKRERHQATLPLNGLKGVTPSRVNQRPMTGRGNSNREENRILVLRPTFQPRTNRSDRTGPRPQTSRLPTAKHVFSCGWGRRGRARTGGPFMLLAFPLEYESRCGRENIPPPSKRQNQQPQPGVVQRCSRSFRPSGAVTADCSGQNNFSAIPPSPQSPTSISQQTTAAVARAAATVNGSVK